MLGDDEVDYRGTVVGDAAAELTVRVDPAPVPTQLDDGTRVLMPFRSCLTIVMQL